MRNRDGPAGPQLRCSVGFRPCDCVMVTPMPWPRNAVDQLLSGTTGPLNGRIRNITEISILRGWLSEGRPDLTIRQRAVRRCHRSSRLRILNFSENVGV